MNDLVNFEGLEPLPAADICSLGGDDQESMAGWCPNGGLQDGICQPFNNQRIDWMGRYSGARSLRIQDCILPGTHHSAFDKKAPHTPSSETCQDVGPFSQLVCGIRVLDLRVQFFSGYPAGDPRRFSIFHSTTSGRTVAGDVLRDLLMFRLLQVTSREIVILDFHEFKNFTDAAHLELATLIKQKLGEQHLVTPSMARMTINQIWNAGPANTVIAYKRAVRDAKFWDGVNQRWSGSHTPTNNELRDFIARVGRETKGELELKSVQACKYALPFFVPNDRSGDLMTWFASGPGKPILNHYIINTDWSLRQRLVDNCIHGNHLRAQSLRYAQSPEDAAP
ncbi:hypothetical protein RAM80_15145 [Pseudomonas sp. App30]|uniref:hypothetical protein n=1 Tax=Pseudomonas sp. App30 TaxID=3068990 RepID=UPI003A80CCED